MRLVLIFVMLYMLIACASTRRYIPISQSEAKAISFSDVVISFPGQGIFYNRYNPMAYNSIVYTVPSQYHTVGGSGAAGAAAAGAMIGVFVIAAIESSLIEKNNNKLIPLNTKLKKMNMEDHMHHSLLNELYSVRWLKINKIRMLNPTRETLLRRFVMPQSDGLLFVDVVYFINSFQTLVISADVYYIAVSEKLQKANLLVKNRYQDGEIVPFTINPRSIRLKDKQIGAQTEKNQGEGPEDRSKNLNFPVVYFNRYIYIHERPAYVPHSKMDTREGDGADEPKVVKGEGIEGYWLSNQGENTRKQLLFGLKDLAKMMEFDMNKVVGDEQKYRQSNVHSAETAQYYSSPGAAFSGHLLKQDNGRQWWKGSTGMLYSVPAKADRPSANIGDTK